MGNKYSNLKNSGPINESNEHYVKGPKKTKKLPESESIIIENDTYKIIYEEDKKIGHIYLLDIPKLIYVCTINFEDKELGDVQKRMTKINNFVLEAQGKQTRAY